MRKIGMFLLAAAIFGCGGVAVMNTGWTDNYTKLGRSGGYNDGAYKDHYAVAFMGATREFTQKGAYYRAAEVSYEKEMRYFEVLEQEDKSMPTRKQMGPKLVVHGSEPFTNLHLAFHTTKPKTGKVFDAHKILNEWPVPGTDKRRTVKDRQDK